MTTVNLIQAGDGDRRHGTPNGYINHRCRCRACTDAHTLYCRGKELARSLPEGDPRHGSENGYGNYNCRCRPCTDAWSLAALLRKRRQRAAV